MIDPYIIVINAGLIGVLAVALTTGSWRSVALSVIIYGAVLLSISYVAGYPTNIPFPSNAIVYGLTTDHVWAAPKDNPYPPRAYIFQAPPEWFEERDRRKGQPFEVDKSEQEGKQGIEGQPPSDRDSGEGWIIVPTILPPKDE